MKVVSLNSGSNGNVFYFGTSTECILIDVGLSCKEIEKRANQLNLNLNNLKAIFISHEHSDHIFGLKTLLKKYLVPLYISKKTLLETRLAIPEHQISFFKSHEEIQIGGFNIVPFPTQHDAADPHGFFITHSGKRAGVFTDIGVSCDQVKYYFNLCQAAFLECNYDDHLLDQGPYSFKLKERIKGSKGHLSNRDALRLFQEHRSNELSDLFISHLSAENNDAKMALELFRNIQSGVNIHLAGRTSPSVLIDLSKSNSQKSGKSVQLDLFQP